jgi:hypothetical protein
MRVLASIRPSEGRHSVGESQNQRFQLSSSKLLCVDLQGPGVTSDGGLIFVRELDERFGLSGPIGEHLVDSRTGQNRQSSLADLRWQSVDSRLAGYEDLSDAAWLSADPTFRLMGSKKVWEQGVAPTLTLRWFETDLLPRKKNLTGLARLNRELVANAEGVRPPHRVVLDMNSSKGPVYGEQEQSAYTGYFGSVCYHPLPRFNSQGDCLAAKLHAGNVHNADGWEGMLLPEIERQQQNGKVVASRGDAELVADECTAALSKGRRTTGAARTVLLALAG